MNGGSSNNNTSHHNHKNNNNHNHNKYNHNLNYSHDKNKKSVTNVVLTETSSGIVSRKQVSSPVPFTSPNENSMRSNILVFESFTF